MKAWSRKTSTTSSSKCCFADILMAAHHQGLFMCGPRPAHRRRAASAACQGVSGALHYEPLWLLVLITPIWLGSLLDSEEQRIWADTLERVREQLRMMSREGE